MSDYRRLADPGREPLAPSVLDKPLGLVEQIVDNDDFSDWSHGDHRGQVSLSLHTSTEDHQSSCNCQSRAGPCQWSSEP